jgi:hypothetical protein
VGVLDADRGSWGDPLADWTFFLLPRRASPQEQALFWQAYGQPGAGPGAQFRAQVYQGLHQGKILSVARRDGNERALKRAYRALADVVNALGGLPEQCVDDGCAFGENVCSGRRRPADRE